MQCQHASIHDQTSDEPERFKLGEQGHVIRHKRAKTCHLTIVEHTMELYLMHVCEPRPMSTSYLTGNPSL